MKKRIFSIMAASILLAGVVACVNTVDGHKRGGWPMSKDKIESTYERPIAQVVNATLEVLKFNGTLTSHNVVNNSMVARVNTRTVYVRVEQVDAVVTRIVTQVRTQGGGSDIVLASEIDKQVGMRLVATPK